MNALNFVRVCLYVMLVLLVLKPMFASPYRIRDVDEADEIPGTNDEFVRFMQNSTIKFCTCGLSVLQRRFCNMDFALIGRKVGPATPFYGDSEHEGIPYTGLIIPVAVERVFRGSMQANTIVNLHYILGSHCGKDHSAVPEAGKLFLITGYQSAFQKHGTNDKNSLSKGDEKKEIEKIFLVTTCSDSFNVNTLSKTQIAGVFLNYYCSRFSVTKPALYVNQEPPKDTSTCYFHYSKAKCYDKYAVCLRPNGVATWHAIQRLYALPSVLAAIPVELHDTLKSSTGVGDQDFFDYCLMHVNLPKPEIPGQ